MKLNISNKSNGALSRSISLLITSMALLVFCSISAAQTLMMDYKLGQRVFSTPEMAARTLVKAISERDGDAMDKILGADHRQLLPVDKIDPVDRDNFLAAWSTSHALIAGEDQQRLLAVGKNNWTLPIPLAEANSGWYFDVDAGVELMRIRRIGRNELAAMQAVLAYYDAQMEYAEQDHNMSGVLEYAQKFISSPGKHDGLYWEIESGEQPSPLGHLFAETSPENAYHGYRYRILKSQGKHAQGGAYSYMLGNRMTGGFALIAWPAEYGDSGVMSFTVSHNGIIYEKDLGPDSAALASATEKFDPTADWKPVQEVQVQQANLNKE